MGLREYQEEREGGSFSPYVLSLPKLRFRGTASLEVIILQRLKVGRKVITSDHRNYGNQLRVRYVCSGPVMGEVLNNQ